MAGFRFDNLTGSASIIATTVFGHVEDNARIETSSGTLSSLAITNSTFRDNSVGPPGNDGLLVRANSTGTISSVNVTGSSFLRNRAVGLQFITDNAGTLTTTVGTSTFSDNNIGTDFEFNSTGAMTFTTSGNTYNSPTKTTAASPINVFQGTGAGVGNTLKGTITNNNISNNNSSTGPGIRIAITRSGTTTLLVSGNTISGVQNRGIEAIAADGSPVMNLTLTNNNITVAGVLALEGIYVQKGSATGDNPNICAKIGSGVAATKNGDSNTASSPFDDIRLRDRFGTNTFKLTGYTGGNTDTTAVANYLIGTNNITDASATVSLGPSPPASGGFVGGACATP